MTTWIVMDNTAIGGNRQPEGGGDVTDPVGCHVKGSHEALPSLGLSAQGNARHTKRVGIYYIQQT